MHRCPGWTTAFYFCFSYKSVTMHLHLQFCNSNSGEKKNKNLSGFQVHLFGSSQFYLSTSLGTSTIIEYFGYTAYCPKSFHYPGWRLVLFLELVHCVLLLWCLLRIVLLLWSYRVSDLSGQVWNQIYEEQIRLKLYFFVHEREKRVLLLFCNPKSGLCSLNIFTKDNSAHSVLDYVGPYGCLQNVAVFDSCTPLRQSVLQSSFVVEWI